MSKNLLFLTRFNKNLNEKIDIKIEEWEQLENEISGIKFQPNEGAHHRCIKVYSENAKEWIPVFYIEDNGHGEQKYELVYFDETTYNKGIEIAKKLDAVIWREDEDSLVIYHPKFGEFDKVYHEEMPLEYLREYISLYGDDNHRFKEFLGEKRQEMGRIIEKEFEAEKRAKFQKWLLIVIILFLLQLLLFRLFTLFS